ncbi:MAG TPA: hypothetical protein VKG43_00045 [Acidimicrobiales bacterium]|nr:hypothetical protein [Acidimicrobiales bacterium]
MSDVVQLSLPVRADLVVLARLTAATIASRAGFGVEEIEDLRLAVDELCLSLVGGDSSGRLMLEYSRDNDVIEISCTYVPDSDGANQVHVEPNESDLSVRILEALVDEHGRDTGGDQPRAWLRKRRVHAAL